MFATGCASSSPQVELNSPVPDPVARGAETLSIPEAVSATDSLLATLTLQQKIGQLVMPWLLGNYEALDSDVMLRAASWIDEYEVGGIIISIGSPLDVAAKLNSLQRRSKLPLLVAADLEWGSGMRLVGGTAFPMPMALGASRRELDAYQMGRITAIEARAVGIHMTFSPVADVNNNANNPIINTRSFGEDPAAISALLPAYIEGAEQHGLYTTAKHFPGHGDTGSDSHIDIPVLQVCWNRLDSLELGPFRTAVTAGVTAVMTAHIAMPCVTEEEELPATLSRRIMSDILRDSLGFEGLVVTDALMMGAIVNSYGPGETAVMALEAGSDLLLMPADIGVAIEAVAGAVESGRISTDRLDESVRRVLELKLRAGLMRSRTVNLDRVHDVVGIREHQEIADGVAARALTLVQEGDLPAFAEDRHLALVTYAEETNLTVGIALAERLRAAGYSVRAFRLYPASGVASYDSARTLIEESNRAVFASSVRPIAWRGHVDLPELLAALILEADSLKPTLLASLGSPYLLNQLEGFGGAYMLAWSAALATERAVADAIAGRIPITGRLPISISEEFRRGHGIEVLR